MKDPYSPEMLEKYYAKRKATEERAPQKAKPSSEKRNASEEILASLVGERVTARMMDGEVLRGVLKKVSKYELVLEAEGRELLVFKHAVAYVSKEKAPSTIAE